MNVLPYPILFSLIAGGSLDGLYEHQTIAWTKRAEELIPKLGDPAFRVREAASKELVELKHMAKKALEEGCKSSTPEIADRCQRLLPLALESYTQALLERHVQYPDSPISEDLPGAKDWFRLVGKTKVSQTRYLEMIRNHRAVLTRVQHKPQNISLEYDSLVQDLYTRNRTSTVTVRNEGISQSDLTLWLFLGSLVEHQPLAGVNGWISPYTLLNHPRLMEGLSQEKENEPFKALYLAWIGQEKNPNVLRRALQIAGTANLKECRPLAMKLAKYKNQMPITRSIALVVAGQFSTVDQLPDLESFLDDKIQVSRILGANPRTVQIRDIALGLCVKLTNQTMTDYGFNTNANSFSVSVSHLNYGFPDDEKRDAAHDRWKKFREKKK